MITNIDSKFEDEFLATVKSFDDNAEKIKGYVLTGQIPFAKFLAIPWIGFWLSRTPAVKDIIPPWLSSIIILTFLAVRIYETLYPTIGEFMKSYVLANQLVKSNWKSIPSKESLEIELHKHLPKYVSVIMKTMPATFAYFILTIIWFILTLGWGLIWFFSLNPVMLAVALIGILMIVSWIRIHTNTVKNWDFFLLSIIENPEAKPSQLLKMSRDLEPKWYLANPIMRVDNADYIPWNLLKKTGFVNSIHGDWARKRDFVGTLYLSKVFQELWKNYKIEI